MVDAGRSVTLPTTGQSRQSMKIPQHQPTASHFRTTRYSALSLRRRNRSVSNATAAVLQQTDSGIGASTQEPAPTSEEQYAQESLPTISASSLPQPGRAETTVVLKIVWRQRTVLH